MWESVIRFRWVYCQLETLRQCLPQSVRRTLNELPESLDDTYERILMEIKRANQAHAYRMLQCLAVAIRPLSVAELAELLAFDFDVATGGIPKLNADWRWEDHEQAVLSMCSSLITVIPGDSSMVVQFSHFSVKEFLMSDRLARSMEEISRYHISPEDAHTVLARACLGVLLRDPDVKDNTDRAPLARYAAEHWVSHAQVEKVTSRVRDGMERLFDPDETYFEAWVGLHDADAVAAANAYVYGPNTSSQEPRARPLYYAALSGFYSIVEHLILKYPQHPSAAGGRLGTALHSASFAGHLQIVQSLLRQGVHVDIRGHANSTPLRYASWFGHCDVVQCLIDYGSDVDTYDDDKSTPLMWAATGGHIDVVRVLLKHKADINSKDNESWTPLHYTWGYNSKGYYPQVVRSLLEHGANANSRTAEGETPLHVVTRMRGNIDIARILLEHGADIDAGDTGEAPLQMALARGGEIARLLSEYHSGRV